MRALTAGLLMAMAAALFGQAFARTEFSQISAALGWGRGGLFHEERFGGAEQSNSVGRFSANAYWLDIGYLFTSEVTIGLRAHHMRVSLNAGGEVGELELLPAAVFVGYRHAVLTSRLRGFATLGAGFGRARFYPSDDSEQWQRPGGGPVRVDQESPPVFQITAGADFALTEELAFELALNSVFVDAGVSYEPAGSAKDFSPQHTYDVAARHLMLMAGIRWCAEWW